MNRSLPLILAVCAACAGSSRTTVLRRYDASRPPARVRVEAANATGQELPLPPPGLVEVAVRVVTRQPDADGSIADDFARAAAGRLTSMGIEVRPQDAAAPLLRITIARWDVHDGQAAGAVVFVDADYQLLDEHGGVLWEVAQKRQPVRFSGPNLSRYEVARVARTCVELALVSLRASETVR